MGGWEKFQDHTKKKKKLGGGQGENKAPKEKKLISGEKKTGKPREKIKLQKKG